VQSAMRAIFTDIDEIAAGVESYLVGETDKDMRRSRLWRVLLWST
jgi:hypothetical protein